MCEEDMSFFICVLFRTLLMHYLFMLRVEKCSWFGETLYIGELFIHIYNGYRYIQIILKEIQVNIERTICDLAVC